MITVFYDGLCGLCSKEIRHYKKIAPPGRFIWEDITHSRETLEECGISLEEGLKILHVKNQQGEIKKGVEGFLVIWSQLPYWNLFGKIVAFPVIRHCMNGAYYVFAHWRFKRLQHCQLAKEAEK